MIVGIDGNEANVAKRVGISEYAYELLRQFHKLRAERIAFKIYLKETLHDDLPRENDRWKYRVFGPKKLWTQIRLPLDLYLTKPRPDIFFTPTHYAPRFAPMPTVISIMDMSFVRFPQLFREKDLYQLKNWTAYSAKRAKRILTISQASKSDIIAEYQIPDENVIVTYPGIKPIAQLTPHVYPMNTLQRKFGISDTFILFVGTLQPRKNITRLIEAYAKSQAGAENVQLVIVGKKGWLYDEILQAPAKFNVQKNVQFLEFVSDEDLATLYTSALFFVLPSLYEGFGLPVLEAMKYGCPVITSNVSSLPEAGGDAALYVDPENVSDITEKIDLLLRDSSKRSEMKEKGLVHVKNFSWEKTAKETLAVLESLSNAS